MACEWRDSSPKFNELVNKFCFIRRVSKDEDNIDVNVILDQLNAFRIDAAVGENHKVSSK